MAFGDTETLTPEEIASLRGQSIKPDSKSALPKVVSVESLPKVVGEPVDVFSDIEAFKLWKADQPETSKWDTVKQVSGELGSQFWETAKTLPKLALKTGEGLINPAKLPEALKANAAFAAEVGSEAYKGYATMGKFMQSAGQKGLAASAGALGADKEAQKFHEEEALKAEMDFYRTARDFTSTVNDGRVILDNVKNTVVGAINAKWAGENTFTDTEVNTKAATFVSNAVDPDAFAPLAKAALRGYAGEILYKVANIAPPEGVIRAAERDVVTAIAARSDAQEALLAAKAAGADAAPLVADLGKAEQDLIEANQYLKARLADLDAQAALGKGTAQVATGKVIEGVGRGTEWLGEKLGAINRGIGSTLDQFGKGGGESAVRDAANSVPGWGAINKLDNFLEGTGTNIRLAGQYISAPESSLGYFQSLARAMPEDSFGRWSASRMERFENLATTGRWIMDSVDTTAKTTAIGAGFGALSGDATAGATQGFWFGLAGSQFGQFARMNSPEEVRARQQVDVAIAKKRRENAPGDQAKLFDEAGAGLQLATATFEQAYPDLNIRFTREGGKGAAGWYEFDGKFGQVTIDLDHPTPVAALFTHEVKHHLGRNPEIKQAVETKLLGDPNTGEAGIFTARDAEGRPILEEFTSAENPEVTQKRFKLVPEFDQYREQYLQRLRDSNLPTIEYERDPKLIAHEIWAESEAANLLGRQVNGKFDIIASSQMGPLQRLVSDTVAGSELVRNSDFMQRALAKVGVTFDGMSGKAANTGLFKNNVELKGLTQAVEKYNRMRDSERVLNEDPDFRDARSYTEAEILSSPQLMDMFSGGHDVVRDPVTGKMRFISEKEAKRRAVEFTDTLKKELSAYTGREPGVVQEQLVEDSLGRVAKVWRGTNIPETVIKKMEDSGRFNDVQLKNLRALNQVLKLGRGGEVNFTYQPASKRGGKMYRTRPITERTETPMSIQITQDGNVVINTISQEKLQRNAVEAIKAGKAELWGNNFQALWSDVGVYLKNHQEGLGGAANGLGEAKRDFINALFGQLTKEQRNANPLIDTTSERKARTAGIVQSRRLDRVSRMTVLSSQFKPDYASVSRNFSPAKADAPGTKVPGTPEPKAVTTDDPWAEMRKWNRQEGTKFSRADAEGVKITTEIRAGGEEMLVAARSNGRLVGYVQINPNYSPRSWGWLDIEVAKPWQRLGIGERLYNAAMDAASEAKKRFAMSSKSPDGKKFFPVVEERRRNPEPEADAPGTKVTETPEFKKWSGDKPVFRADEVDTTNPPRRGVFEVFHGTKEDVTTFKAKYPDGLIFTTTDPKFAGEWGQNRNLDGRSPRNYPKDIEAQDRARAEAMRPADDAPMPEWEKYFDNPEYREPRRAKTAADTNVMKLFANVEKAFDPRKDYKLVEPLLRSLPGYEGIIAKGSHKVGNWVVYENKAVVDLLKSKGYDAMWLTESVGGTNHETLAVFSPNQLKSATGNRGTFDPTNPDIRYSPGSATLEEVAEQTYKDEPLKERYADQRFAEAIPLTFAVDKSGKVVMEKKGPKIITRPYNFYDSPVVAKLGIEPDVLESLKTKLNVATLSEIKAGYLDKLEPAERAALDKMVDAYAARAVDDFARYSKDPEVKAASGWYSEIAEFFKQLMPDAGDRTMFLEFLGGTSPNTSVEQNFLYALDLFNRWKKGELQSNLEAYRKVRDNVTELAAPYAERVPVLLASGKQKTAFGEPVFEWRLKEGAESKFRKDYYAALVSDGVEPDSARKRASDFSEEDLLTLLQIQNGAIPRRVGGGKYGVHTGRILQILDGVWRSVTDAPKAPNFTENLAGISTRATIDVWAARWLRRLGHDGITEKWRILPMMEQGVGNSDFFLGQEIFEETTKRLNERFAEDLGRTIQPDDLQAIMWFAEKREWKNRGWAKFEDLGDFRQYTNKLVAQPDGTFKLNGVTLNSTSTDFLSTLAGVEIVGGTLEASRRTAWREMVKAARKMRDAVDGDVVNERGIAAASEKFLAAYAKLGQVFNTNEQP